MCVCRGWGYYAYVVHSATRLKIWHQKMEFTGVQSSNELQWLDLQIGHQDTSSRNDNQGKKNYWLSDIMLMLWNIQFSLHITNSILSKTLTKGSSWHDHRVKGYPWWVQCPISVLYLSFLYCMKYHIVLGCATMTLYWDSVGPMEHLTKFPLPPLNQFSLKGRS